MGADLHVVEIVGPLREKWEPILDARIALRDKAIREKKAQRLIDATQQLVRDANLAMNPPEATFWDPYTAYSVADKFGVNWVLDVGPHVVNDILDPHVAKLLAMHLRFHPALTEKQARERFEAGCRASGMGDQWTPDMHLMFNAERDNLVRVLSHVDKGYTIYCSL